MLFSGLVWAQQSTSQIVIVKSSDNAYFNQTIETLVNHVDQTLRVQVVMAEDFSAGLHAPEQDVLYIALGQPAVNAIAGLSRDSKVINAYLTLEQFHNLKDKGLVTVLLDQPLHRYLAFSKFMLQIDSIGMISETSVVLNQQESRLLEQLELALSQYQVDPENKLLPVLRGLLQQNDALLMLPRQSIYNRDSLKGVLLTSYRNRKPVISYSPAHVKSGALASIYSSPTDIGRHLSILVNNHLQKQPRSGLKFEFARFYSITLNSRVAHALGLSLPSEIELRSKLDKVHQ